MKSFKNVKSFSTPEFVLIFAASIILTISCLINKNNPKPNIEIFKQDSAITLNRNLLLLFNLGNKRLIADLIWIQTLIEGDEEHYSKNDLNSWMYHRFMSIADLDPNFYENYLHGGMYLSIVKDDPVGASEVFERGLKLYPNDYSLNYNLGYCLIFELGEKERGLINFEKILNHKNLPSFFPSIVNKIRFEISGDYDAAMFFLQNRLHQSKDASIRDKLKSEIYSLKAERDLNCLNNNKIKCELLDYDGVPYKQDIYKKWISAKNVRKYRLKYKNKN